MSSGTKKNSFRVLVHDSSQTCRKLHSKYWLNAGHDVVLSGQRNEVSLIDLVRRDLIDATRGQHAFDLIMMSLDLDLANVLRRMGYLGVIVIVSASLTVEDKVEITSHGFHPIEKPMKDRDFQMILKEVSTEHKQSTQSSTKANHQFKILPKATKSSGKKKHVDSEAFAALVYTSTFRERALRFLIVDDAPAARKVLSFVVSRNHHTVVQADNAIVALSMVENSLFTQKYASASFSAFHVVMVTNMMKGTSGSQLARHLRHSGFEGIIIGMMGNPQPHDIEHFKQNGVNAVLAKPIKYHHITNAFQDLCFPDGLPDGFPTGDAPRREPKAASVARSPSVRILHSLVVDFSRCARKEWRMVLQDMGHAVVECSTGAEAIGRVRHSLSGSTSGDIEIIDLILMRVSFLHEVEEMRLLDYTGIIIGIVSPHDDKPTHSSVVAHGLSCTIDAPLTGPKLRNALANIHHHNSHHHRGEPAPHAKGGEDVHAHHGAVKANIPKASSSPNILMVHVHEHSVGGGHVHSPTSSGPNSPSSMLTRKRASSSSGRVSTMLPSMSPKVRAVFPSYEPKPVSQTRRADEALLSMLHHNNDETARYKPEVVLEAIEMLGKKLDIQYPPAEVTQMPQSRVNLHEELIAAHATMRNMHHQYVDSVDAYLHQFSFNTIINGNTSAGAKSTSHKPQSVSSTTRATRVSALDQSCVSSSGAAQTPPQRLQLVADASCVMKAASPLMEVAELSWSMSSPPNRNKRLTPIGAPQGVVPPQGGLVNMVAPLSAHP